MLKGTSFAPSYLNATVTGETISRYDMVQLMANIMVEKGFAMSDKGARTGSAPIADWTSILEDY